mmetsp:Transcript_16985/g.30020  ORF Transcript_16985/g.30020 Transcript_16985/m.30020 type:complete len:237 (-) Transcript_16985:189-899(-)
MRKKEPIFTGFLFKWHVVRVAAPGAVKRFILREELTDLIHGKAKARVVEPILALVAAYHAFVVQRRAKIRFTAKTKELHDWSLVCLQFAIWAMIVVYLMGVKLSDANAQWMKPIFTSLAFNHSTLLAECLRAVAVQALLPRRSLHLTIINASGAVERSQFFHLLLSGSKASRVEPLVASVTCYHERALYFGLATHTVQSLVVLVIRASSNALLRRGEWGLPQSVRALHQGVRAIPW